MVDNQEFKLNESEKVIYFAGGCFWAIEYLYDSMQGVIDATSGYANGSGEKEANYTTVSQGNTGFRECVQVIYDKNIVSLEQLLYNYFYVVDTTRSDGQGNDIGHQYTPGIFYLENDLETQEIIDRVVSVEKKKNDVFTVDITTLTNFFKAEDYHQDYLQKNPYGYCHIPRSVINILVKSKIDPSIYKKPEDLKILSNLSYLVTQEDFTEPAFNNEYWNHFEKGIYVDIVTGEPLFSSKDKFKSYCGWPAFSKPIEQPVVNLNLDLSHNMVRTEVRSRVGDSHLGHVFSGDSESPNGIRYCINSAALRFIPYEDLEKEGYGYLIDYLSF